MFFYVLQLNKVGSYCEYANVWFSDIRLFFFTCYNWTRLGVIENTPTFDLAISDCFFYVLQLNKVGSYWEYAIVWFSDIRLCFFTCYNWTRLGVIENTPSFDLAISDCVVFFTCYNWRLGVIENTLINIWTMLRVIVNVFNKVWLTDLSDCFVSLDAPYSPVRFISEKVRK